MKHDDCFRMLAIGGAVITASILSGCQTPSQGEGFTEGVIAMQINVDGWILREDRDIRTWIEVDGSRRLEHRFHFVKGTDIAHISEDIASAIREDGFRVVLIPELGAMRIGPIDGLTGFSGDGLSLDSVARVGGQIRGLGYAQ